MVLFFAEDSQHPFLKRAMRDARRVRKQQHEAEAARRLVPEPRAARSKSFAGRSPSAGREE
ncbi:hypothetical protein I3J27_19725 [Bradyrhizobium xenonodulans]|uniref:Uncharacterized protein n=1 Tax=Bradyrhizobium xenonodulans TaxID=2736875 RepID=A0ABY7MEF1_9BRAD|nr:hypothetical protein [Bradyrhizobium xenonodulans]WBL75280.1 hypothetical protein I3J27_19725 [Bradyrhizobium xenonodulans]